MEKLNHKYHFFSLALATLEEVLTFFEQQTPGSVAYSITRDAVIKRFEYTVETFWKLLKEYLTEFHGQDVPSSPKGVLREAVIALILTEDELMILLDVVDSRNITVHTYNQALAQEISEKIPGYYYAIKHVAQRINATLEETK